MVNRSTLLLVLLLMALLMPQVAEAQFSPGSVSKGGAVKEYRRVSGDSMRVRASKVEKKSTKGKSKGKGKVAAKKKTAPQKSVQEKPLRIDSVMYQPVRYSLGDRVIMVGDCGHDVRTVAVILVKKLYMDEKQLIYADDGAVLYDGELVDALKRFQEFNGLYPDGIIGTEVIKALRRKKDK